jgi:hypothetical protein
MKGLLLFFVVLCSILYLYGPIYQDQKYHDFADSRMLYANIPNTMNVVSNVGFMLVSYVGMAILIAGTAEFRREDERYAYMVLFIALLCVSAGSAYYHSNPNDKTLFWDRLPMTVAFMSVLSIIVREKVNDYWGKLMLIPSCLIGVLSLFTDDLRMYVCVQAVAMVSAPYFVYYYPHGAYSHDYLMTWCAFFYALSKGAEFSDHLFFRFMPLSGHTLKHILAAIGLFFIPLMLHKRRCCKNV